MNKGAMSTSRVAEADAMAVDEAGGVAPSREWMQAAQRALETDGILDGSPSKRHKVCICICTLMSQHTCTPKLLGESLSEDVPVRVSRAYILLERTLLFPKKRSLLKKGPLRLPPKSLPKHCRSTAEAAKNSWEEKFTVANLSELVRPPCTDAPRLIMS